MAKNEIPRSFLNGLDAYIEENLPKVLEKYTTETLGDRSKYIGASDIAGCLRKSFLSKKKWNIQFLNTLYFKEVI